MGYPAHVWSQVKNLTADDIMRALAKDKWTLDTSGGSQHIYLSHDRKRRVSIHYHPKKTYGQKMLQGILDDIGWSEADMRRVKLIK